MNTPVRNVFCQRCRRETYHDHRHNGFACSECEWTRSQNGSSPSLTNNTGRGGSGEGGSSRGGSGEGGSSSETTTAYATSAYAEKLSGEALKALDGDREFARFICKKAGIEFKQDLPQTVVLGGTEITIRLWADNNRRYVIRPVVEGERNPTFPGTKTRSLALGQFYASIRSGRLCRPTGPSLARWKRRALAEWGVVELPPVVLKSLPDDAPTHVERVWAGMAVLVPVRRLTEPDERSLPLSRCFMPDWCGCDEKTFRRALIWLERNEFVGRDGQVAVGKPKDMTLWWIAEEPA